MRREGTGHSVIPLSPLVLAPLSAERIFGVGLITEDVGKRAPARSPTGCTGWAKGLERDPHIESIMRNRRQALVFPRSPIVGRS